MNTDQYRIVNLIGLALSGELKEEERLELEAWCQEKEENQKFYDRLCREDLFAREYPLYRDIDEKKALQCFEQTIGIKNRKQILFRQLLRYAAILILPLSVIAVWQWNRQQPVTVETEAIVPGSAKAVLTLAGGQQVKLTGQTQQEIEVAAGIKVKEEIGTLAYQATAGHKGDRREQNTLSTGRGGEYRLVLADGTKVFLNAATTLKYPVAFNGEIRKVELEGEAYFEVAKDPDHPFIVETKGMEVKVYGTSFNINTMRTDEIRTVLVEGAIGIRSMVTDREYRVSPGQMAVWSKADGSLELKEVDVALYTAWKEGIFRFNCERLEDILNTLANWYDLEVFYQNPGIKNLHFSGYMERYEQIGIILEAITEATGVQFATQGKTIVVSK